MGEDLLVILRGRILVLRGSCWYRYTSRHAFAATKAAWLHEFASAEIGLIINDKTYLEIVFGIWSGDFDIIVPDLDFLL
jgi:hypothetical protein